MRGVMLIYKPNEVEPEVRTFSRPPDLGDLKEAIGGGWLEKVSQFDTIEFGGELHHCVVLVDEEAKLNFRSAPGKTERAPDPPNDRATVQWDRALRRAGHPGLLRPATGPFGPLADYLVGRVCVLFGDDQFMGSL
jgi:hypothetical protein